jgi:head-tail adaptor
MQSGRMNQGFVVQRETRVKSDGEYLSEWSNIHDLSGEVTYHDQKEGIDGEQKRAVDRIKIRTWDVGVKAVDRIIFDGYVWDIDSVKPWGIQNDFYVEIEATKTDAQAVSSLFELNEDSKKVNIQLAGGGYLKPL